MTSNTTSKLINFKKSGFTQKSYAAILTCFLWSLTLSFVIIKYINDISQGFAATDVKLV